MKKYEILNIAILILCISGILTAQLPNYLPSNGLIAYYPFNGNANDESNNAFDGVVNGASLSPDRLGNSAGAYLFASGNSISVAHNDALRLANTDFTISAWVKLSETPAIGSADQPFYTIVGKRQYGASEDNYLLGVSTPLSSNGGQKLSFAQGPAGVGIEYSAPFQLTLNEWTHVLITYIESNQELTFFVNGNQVGSVGGAIISNLGNTSPLSIGNDASGYANYFPGFLDEIGIWNRALNEDEILSLTSSSPYLCNISIPTIYSENGTYLLNGDSIFLNTSFDSTVVYQWYKNNLPVVGAISNIITVTDPGNYTLHVSNDSCSRVSNSISIIQFTECLNFSIPTNGLIGFWPFCGNANDESGNGNNGIVTGAQLTTDRFNIPDRAYSFSGNNTFIKANTINLPLGTASSTMSVWFKSDAYPSGSSKAMLSYGTWNGNQARYLGLRGGSSDLLTYAQYFNDINIPFNYELNTWYHYVATYESNVVKIYVNGNLLGSYSISNPNTTNGQVSIGISPGNTDGFQGDLDDAAIWNRVLSDEEILGLYEGNTCNWNLSASNTAICTPGDSISLVVSFFNQNGGFTQIDSQTENFTAEWNHQYNVIPGTEYKLVVSGSYGWGASPCPLTSRDAAFDFINNEVIPYNGLGIDGLYCTAFLPLAFERPQPDVYQPNHSYTYYFTPDTNTITIGYYDCCYNDNCGQITYALFESQSQAAILWSTGDTTASIIVNPTETQTYSATVTSGGVICTQTITIFVGEATTDTIFVSLFAGEFYSFNNQLLSEAGVYTALFSNQAGCDSIITLILTYEELSCTLNVSDSALCIGEESTLTVQTNALDTLVWGPNLLNGPFTGGTLSIIEFSAAQGASNYGGNGLGSNCNELWRPYGTFCDEGIAANSPFLSEKSNNNSGATWNRGSGGYGVLVLDLQDVKTFNALSAFQMFSDGKLTQLSMFYWPENNIAVPASSNAAWVSLFTNELIGPGAQSGNTVTDPTLFEFETIQSRYIMFHAYNSGIYGNNTFIEIRSLKLFNKSQANADILWSTGETTPTITVSPTQTTTYSVTVNQGGQTCNSEVTVNVSQAPNVSFEPDLAAFCNNSGTVDLSGGSPAGGTYSGPGVVNNTFSPALAGGGLHTITYTVSNSQGCTDEASTTFEVAICTGSSINEPGFASVWPNPFDDIVSIRLNTTSPSSLITLRLTDAAGRIVVLKTIQENQNDLNLDVSQLSQGIYTLSLSTSERYFVSRLVK